MSRRETQKKPDIASALYKSKMQSRVTKPKPKYKKSTIPNLASIIPMSGTFPTDETIALKGLIGDIEREKERANHNLKGTDHSTLKCEGGHKMLVADCKTATCFLCPNNLHTQVLNHNQGRRVATNATDILRALKFEFMPGSGDADSIIQTLGLLNKKKVLMGENSILKLPTFNRKIEEYTELIIREGTGADIYCSIIAYYVERFRRMGDHNEQSVVSVHGIVPIKDFPLSYGLLCTVL